MNSRIKTNLSSFRLPAEWEEHEATWIAWPHEESDWPGKLECIHWVYAEIVRVLSEGERVEIIVTGEAEENQVRYYLEQHRADHNCYRFHHLATDRSWLRDSAPTAVFDGSGALHWLAWNFNGWAKYSNHTLDTAVPSLVADSTSSLLHLPRFASSNERIVLEGGAFDTDGDGTLIVTEECLLSEVQQRNPGISKQEYEDAFSDWLGIRKVVWLEGGISGDDTHGHIDDVCRFVAPGKVVLVYEQNAQREDQPTLSENYRRLQEATDAEGRAIEVICLPSPRTIYCGDDLLPASYANFYIANNTVLVPTFNDKNDRIALDIIAQLFPQRSVVGIHSVDLVLGLGTLHCLTQQQPLP